MSSEISLKDRVFSFVSSLLTISEEYERKRRFEAYLFFSPEKKWVELRKSLGLDESLFLDEPILEKSIHYFEKPSKPLVKEVAIDKENVVDGEIVNEPSIDTSPANSTPRSADTSNLAGTIYFR